MFEPQGIKIMVDLHGLTIREVKQLLEKQFKKIEQHDIGELYLITGRGSHANADGTRGVLKKILPKLLKPYCQDILQINEETGAYKIILKPRQPLFSLKDVLFTLLGNEEKQIAYAKMLEQQIEKNDIEGTLALAAIHLHQAVKGFDNTDKGISLLLKAKKLGLLEADVQLGCLYHEGLVVKQNHDKAFKHFSYAAEKGHPVAQYYVAVCYLHGKGVKYNDEQAVKWMKQAADQGDVYAQDSVGDFYLLGKITAQNKDLGISYKTKAAEQGLADAQIDLARCYATGYGVKQDYPTAFQWYLAAAQTHKAYALYQVGSYLMDGRCGFPPSEVKALSWFLKAAELGDVDGQAQVASLFLFGETSIQDPKKGIEWVLKAIEKKHRFGYYVIAKAHLFGIGVEQHNDKAIYFLKLAAEAGYLEAQNLLDQFLLEKQPSVAKEKMTDRYGVEKAALPHAEKASSALKTLQNTDKTTTLITTPANPSFLPKTDPGITELDEPHVYCYKLGALAYMLIVHTWLIASEKNQDSLRETQSRLYKEFMRRFDLLNIEHPSKKINQKPVEYLLSYVENILKKIGEKSMLAVCFNMGFKMMAVKMIRFTQDEKGILKELLDYLQCVNLEIECMNKIKNLLKEQIASPKEGFIKEFEKLETELKAQLFLTQNVKVTKEIPAIPEAPSQQGNRYSLWYHGAIAISLTAIAVGVVVAKSDVIEEGVKTICPIQ